MSEQALAIRQAWSMPDIAQAAQLACRSKLANGMTEGDLALVMLQARDLGLPPALALQQMHVIKGRVTLSANTMLGLILRSPLCGGVEVNDTTPGTVLVTMRRTKPKMEYTATWGLDDAKRAGLGGDNWRNYPQAMLRARAISQAARIVFPDVLGGMDYTSEEMREEANRPSNGNGNGHQEPPVARVEIVDTTAEPEPPADGMDLRSTILAMKGTAGEPVLRERLGLVARREGSKDIATWSEMGRREAWEAVDAARSACIVEEIAEDAFGDEPSPEDEAARAEAIEEGAE